MLRAAVRLTARLALSEYSEEIDAGLAEDDSTEAVLATNCCGYLKLPGSINAKVSTNNRIETEPTRIALGCRGQQRCLGGAFSADTARMTNVVNR